MLVRVSDGHCLAPGLVTAGEDIGGESRSWRGRRVVGVLESASTGERRLVREVRYDGVTCRYRLGGPGADGWKDPRADESGGHWVEDDGATSYRPFCHLILDRLARNVRDEAFRLHRLPGMPPSRALTRRAHRRGGSRTLVALDACLSAEGGLWVEVAVGGEGGERGWLPVATRSGGECGSRTPAGGEGGSVRIRHDSRMEERSGERYRAA